MEILVKYHSDIDHIEPLAEGDWLDLRVAEDVELHEGDSKLISLGVSMALPEGYEALVIPRSSTFSKYGIIQTNHVGLIDNSYCGDNDVWKYPVYALRDTVIEKNTRICQFRIQKKMPQIKLVTVDRLDGKNRGGFGSTGEK